MTKSTSMYHARLQKLRPRRHRQISRRQPARQASHGRRAGVAVVEFAIVANVLFLVVFTCMEFARLNMVRNLAQDAAYYAARHAMVPGATSDDAVAEAERIMGAMLANGYTVDVDSLNDDSSAVEVTVSISLDEVALFTPMFLGNQTIVSTAKMKTERYNGFYKH